MIVLLATWTALAAHPDAGLCAGRSPCLVAASTPAGVDQRGRDLRVVELHHAAEPTDGEPAFDGDCVLREWFLVGPAHPDGVLLHSACNDGYGARGMGTDHVQIVPGTAARPGHLKASQSGGSSWGWESTATVQLDPVHVQQVHRSSWWILGPQMSTVSLDMRTGRRDMKWSTGSCEAAIEGPGDGDLSGSYQIIPMLDPELGGDWRSLDISRCGARVGSPGAEDPTHMSVVARGPKELLVQVTDQAWVDEAESWLFEDHLELWIGGPLPEPYDNACAEPGPPPSQWGLRLRDEAADRVVPAHGKPDIEAVSIEVVKVDSRTRRARIQLAEAPMSMSLVFSDSDDGRSQRLLATSTLRFGDATSLGGPPQAHQPADGACIVQDRALVWSVAPPRPGEGISGL